jgi:regulator of replication initiation timing
MHPLSVERYRQEEIATLRQENDRLQRENQDLKKRLERAKRVISQLQVAVRRHF